MNHKKREQALRLRQCGSKSERQVYAANDDEIKHAVLSSIATLHPFMIKTHRDLVVLTSIQISGNTFGPEWLEDVMFDVLVMSGHLHRAGIAEHAFDFELSEKLQVAAEALQERVIERMG